MNKHLLTGLAGLLAIGCVTTGKYEAKVAEHNAAVARQRQLEQQVSDLEQQLGDSRKKYDEAAALIAKMKERLTQLGQNVDQLASERGQLAAGLQDAKTRLDELAKQKAAAEARAQVFRNLIDKLRSMIDAGQLKVTIRNGRMQIVLPNDVLFDSGKTELKPAGKTALTQVAQALATIGDRRFLVAGHTDNVPIKTSRYRSNWELSTQRAVEVARLLVSGGMKPEVLGAAGYAEFDPVAANDNPQNKALNRRIEIILEPNLSDLPNLEGLLTESRKG